ncbi:O-methyltransferase [Actinomadura litoris]|uniref:O-methyltransferase n=1 Tax=Actinomadura litoris TaxID=2678616 RepID=UPI001FA75F62|nr:methyltransferase domain-containing protein [Actinomadura litoris]
MEEFPALVTRAFELARAAGFALTREDAGAGASSACLPGVGRFLAVLAAGCVGGRIAELGTGTGVGAAWIADAMPADCTLVTVEVEERFAAVARELLSGDARVEVLTGEAADVVPARGPFDLVFSDAGAHGVDPVGLLRVGGRVVMDDLTPRAALPPGSPLPADDPKRRAFFGDRRLVSTEVVLPDLRNSLLVGTRAR